VTNVTVLDNPSMFQNPFQFEISYECLVPLKDGESCLRILSIVRKFLFLSFEIVALVLVCCTRAAKALLSQSGCSAYCNFRKLSISIAMLLIHAFRCRSRMEADIRRVC
jgi:hypothetical protein